VEKQAHTGGYLQRANDMGHKSNEPCCGDSTQLLIGRNFEIIKPTVLDYFRHMLVVMGPTMLVMICKGGGPR
jgi:hypothetical protein